ncbi:MAG: hypothetical protein GC164_05830 [Phycisphaera sp.]|nr:hypothetical protein [Phycisphaera sp.]
MREILEKAGAEFVPFGHEDDAAQLVATFGAYEAEYAAIRKGVGILVLPQRAVLRFSGNKADVKDFLHRMTTQDVNGMKGGDSRRAFQLNDKGRILADLFIHHGDVDTWLEMDRCDLPGVKGLLEARLFTEDITVEDWSGKRSVIALQGPGTLALLKTVSETDPTPMMEMPGTHHVLKIQGAGVSAYRRDDCGVPGCHLFIPPEKANQVLESLAEAVGGLSPEVEADGQVALHGAKVKGRGIGWLAYNTARIENGHALFHVDFGPDSLPHEAGQGVLKEAASFTKGCYLGQEIVARMQNLGHPKRVVVGLRLEDDRMPIEGAQVFEADASGQSTGKAVGVVTSSTVSPMLGQVAIALAMMKWASHTPGSRIVVAAEGSLVSATVVEGRFV